MTETVRDGGVEERKIGTSFPLVNFGGAVSGHLLHAVARIVVRSLARTRHLVVGQLLETAKLQARAERRPQQQLH